MNSVELTRQEHISMQLELMELKSLRKKVKAFKDVWHDDDCPEDDWQAGLVKTRNELFAMVE